jgi:hypothetical protein
LHDVDASPATELLPAAYRLRQLDPLALHAG